MTQCRGSRILCGAWLALSWLLTLSTSHAAGAHLDPAEVLAKLQTIEFDQQQSFQVRDLTLRRAMFSLNFERGAILFLKPVEGVVTGLLFRGQGTIVFQPPNKIERQQLNYFTGSPILNEHFNEAFLRFTDNSYEELMSL
ncbi:MAG: hypothetical protein U0V70_17145, partial [Terriglobia bacterium]